MTGGEHPSPLVTENESVRHWVEVATLLAAVAVEAPYKVLVTLVEAVEGPVMTKLIKSKRS